MTRARQLSKLGNPNVFSVDASNNVGVNSTSPTEKLNVVGVVSATSFFGDGSNLEGVASAGLGTALSETGGGSVIYFTDTSLSIGATVTVDPPATTDIAYTQYEEVTLTGDADLIIAEGDDFVPDILGLSDGALLDDRIGAGGGGGGISNVVEDTSPQLGGNLDLNGKRIDGTGQINIAGGITVSGISTADSFVGDGSGLTNVTGTGSGIGVSDTGTPVGTAQTINFGTGLSVSSVSAGLVTVTNTVSAGDTADVSTSTLNVVGVATFNDKVRLLDADELHFGSNGVSGDFKIYHDQLNNHNVIYEDVTGAEAILQSNIGGISNNAFEFRRASNTLAMMRETEVVLYSGGDVKLATASSGVNITGIASASAHVSSGIVTYYGDSSYSAAGRWVLGADGTNHYTFTGPGLGHSTLNDPTLYLMRGQTYMFENKMGAHPFRIQSTSNGSSGTQWNVGVTNNDVSNGVLIFEVPFVCPNTLYYQCTSHGNMGGVLNIVT